LIMRNPIFRAHTKGRHHHRLDHAIPRGRSSDRSDHRT
jgi:hypothetical protein